MTNFFLTNEPIVDQCKECENINGAYCKRYASPYAQWALEDGCEMATHKGEKDEKENT